MNKDNTPISKTYATIKLGIDAHVKWYYVARQLDGATPQPVQKMDLDGLLHFVARQQRLAGDLAGEVHTRVTMPGRSAITCTASWRRWECATWWCSRRIGTSGVTGKWWKGKTWAMIGREAPACVVERLRVLIRLLEPVEAEERKLTEAIQDAARDRKIPKGVGPLNFETSRCTERG